MAAILGFIRVIIKWVGVITLVLFAAISLRKQLPPSLDQLQINSPEYGLGSRLDSISLQKSINGIPSSENSQKLSTCNKEATELGVGQKVISFTLYMNGAGDLPMLLEGVERNLKLVPVIYPGWVVRVYTNIPRSLSLTTDLLNTYKSILYWCDITNIPDLGNLTTMDERCWRFLVLGDPLVDIFISRDLDSTISWRERFAVAEWEISSQTIHVMRDNVDHGGNLPILGGMWGAHNMRLGTKLTKRLQQRIIKVAKLSQNKKGYDQFVLSITIYWALQGETMAHDSYFCGEYPESLSLPFPTKRRGNSFVGAVLGSNNTLQPCPEKCKPSYGKNWKYC